MMPGVLLWRKRRKLMMWMVAKGDGTSTPCGVEQRPLGTTPCRSSGQSATSWTSAGPWSLTETQTAEAATLIGAGRGSGHGRQRLRRHPPHHEEGGAAGARLGQCAAPPVSAAAARARSAAAPGAGAAAGAGEFPAAGGWGIHRRRRRRTAGSPAAAGAAAWDGRRAAPEARWRPRLPAAAPGAPRGLPALSWPQAGRSRPASRTRVRRSVPRVRTLGRDRPGTDARRPSRVSPGAVPRLGVPTPAWRARFCGEGHRTAPGLGTDGREAGRSE